MRERQCHRFAHPGSRPWRACHHDRQRQRRSREKHVSPRISERCSRARGSGPSRRRRQRARQSRHPAGTAARASRDSRAGARRNGEAAGCDRGRGAQSLAHSGRDRPAGTAESGPESRVRLMEVFRDCPWEMDVIIMDAGAGIQDNVLSLHHPSFESLRRAHAGSDIAHRWL